MNMETTVDKPMITLATLKDATAQEVFDQAAKHLLKQNRKSMNDTSCMYRSSDGLKCAAGCFISDEEYRSEFESETWESASFPDEHKGLIRDLQLIHDKKEVSEWKYELNELAKKHNLQFIF